VFVALDIQHAMTLRYIFIRGLPGPTVIFPHYPINDKIFDENLLKEGMKEGQIRQGSYLNVLANTADKNFIKIWVQSGTQQ